MRNRRLDTPAQKARRRQLKRERYARDPAKHLAIDRAYKARDPERWKQYAIEWALKHKDRHIGQHLKRKYGISRTQYEEMLTAQRGLCWVCQLPETTIGRGGKPRRLSVDHCHQSGGVRVLLCHWCNLAAGLLKDDPIRTRKLADLFELHVRAIRAA